MKTVSRIFQLTCVYSNPVFSTRISTNSTAPLNVLFQIKQRAFCESAFQYERIPSPNSNRGTPLSSGRLGTTPPLCYTLSTLASSGITTANQIVQKIPEGGWYPVKNMRGGYPPPTLKNERGSPFPPVVPQDRVLPPLRVDKPGHGFAWSHAGESVLWAVKIMGGGCHSSP